MMNISISRVGNILDIRKYMVNRKLVIVQVSTEHVKEWVHYIKILRKINKIIHIMALESFKKYYFIKSVKTVFLYL